MIILLISPSWTAYCRRSKMKNQRLAQRKWKMLVLALKMKMESRRSARSTAFVAPRAQEHHDLDWLHNGGEDHDSVFCKLDRFLVTVVPGNSEMERAKDLENALAWHRQNGVDFDDLHDPDDELSPRAGGLPQTLR